MSEPENTGRKQGGQFAPGVSGNPSGKPAGARHKISRAVETLLEGQHEALTQIAISKALEGDLTALRICLDRIAPIRRDAPVAMALPAVRSAADALLASEMVLAATAAGEVTPDEAARIMSLLTAHKTIVEAGDLEARIAALEGELK